MLEVLTGILVIITGLYALFTFRILKANQDVVKTMREQLDELNRPYITISTTTFAKDHIIYLSIQNTGKTSAVNLNLRLDKDFHSFGRDGKNLREFNIFSREATALTPGTRLLFYLGTPVQLFGDGVNSEKMPPVFTINAKYEQSNGRKFEEATTIDLHPYLMEVSEPDATVDALNHLSNSIQKLDPYLNNICSYLSRLTR